MENVCQSGLFRYQRSERSMTCIIFTYIRYVIVVGLILF